MAELSVAHRAALAQLVEHCPASLLSRLAAECARMPSGVGQTLAELIRDAERAPRRRERVFEPLAPMFSPRADGVAALTFPAAVLPRLWRVASVREPQWLQALDADEGWEPVADRICLAAAAAVRDRPDEVWPPDLEPQTRQQGLEELAGCLDLAHLARRAMPGLETWLRRPDGDQIAGLRLLIRDAAAVSSEGPRRIIDIGFARLADAVLVARILSHVSETARNAGVLDASDFAVFIDRLIDQVRARTLGVEKARPAADGPEAMARRVADIEWCGVVLSELDMNLPAQADGAWGRAIQDLRGRLAAAAAELLKHGESAVDRALPTARVRLAGRMTRPAPVLTAPADGEAMDAAMAGAAAVSALRGASIALGCEALRHGLVERLIEQLSAYADEALTLVNAGEAEDEGNAVALIERAAELLRLIDAAEPARTVRRRAAVAGNAADCGRAA